MSLSSPNVKLLANNQEVSSLICVKCSYFIASEVKTCKQCLQTASAFGGETHLRQSIGVYRVRTHPSFRLCCVHLYVDTTEFSFTVQTARNLVS